MAERTYYLIHNPEVTDCPSSFKIFPTSEIEIVRVVVDDADSEIQGWEIYAGDRGITTLPCEGCGGSLTIPPKVDKKFFE